MIRYLYYRFVRRNIIRSVLRLNGRNAPPIRAYGIDTDLDARIAYRTVDGVWREFLL